jgi:hypothetical protein
VIVVAGGRQRRPAGVADRRHDHLYDAGALVWVSGVGVVERTILRPEVPVYKGLRADGDGFVACAPEVVHHLAVDGEVRSRTGGGFNDGHDAARLDGRLLVASTGTGEVVDLDSGKRWLCGGRSHVSHVVGWHGRRLATRGTRGDLLDLDTGEMFPVADVVVHDGVPGPDGLLWLTAVDGRLIGIDAGGQVARTVAVPVPDQRDEPLGWCRGVAFAQGLVWIGFTRIRATRARERLAWVRGRLRGRHVATRRPTRIVALDLDTQRVVHTVSLEGTGMDAVFALVATS